VRAGGRFSPARTLSQSENRTEEIPIITTLLAGTPLTGRVAVVSGASSGIGAATATHLAKLGANVAVLARRKEKLNTLVDSVTRNGGTAIAVPTDVTNREAVHEAAQQVADRLGTTDLVVNNAGVQLISPITDLRQDDWQRQIDLNVTGVMNVIGAFVPHLTAAAAAGKPADLITTSSIAATRILEKFSVYSGTKAYISHLTRLLRVELGPKNIRVATIEPAWSTQSYRTTSPIPTPVSSWPTSSTRSTYCGPTTSPRPWRSWPLCPATSTSPRSPSSRPPKPSSAFGAPHRCGDR
jgi:NADP-dependent 3-hydroxy acid dehydrogenase YdfG